MSIRCEEARDVLVKFRHLRHDDLQIGQRDEVDERMTATHASASNLTQERKS